MTRRRYVLLGAISLLAVLWGSGCTTPQAPKLSGPEAFSAWFDANRIAVTRADTTPWGGGSRYFPQARTIVLAEKASPATELHEKAHVAYAAMPQVFPLGECNDHTCEGFERGAICIAFVVDQTLLLRTHGWYQPCAAEDLELVRGLLVEIGAW
jgi:hypothetical protein